MIHVTEVDYASGYSPDDHLLPGEVELDDLRREFRSITEARRYLERELERRYGRVVWCAPLDIWYAHEDGSAWCSGPARDGTAAIVCYRTSGSDEDDHWGIYNC